MFKATDLHTSSDITIIDEKWNESNIDSLRLMGRSKNLICPVCKSTVFVKAGNTKIWHFAHHSIENCPLNNESSNILHARQLLYKWLCSKFPNNVSIEKHIKNKYLQRPIDCYVYSPKNNDFLYWIIEKNIRSRGTLNNAIKNITPNYHWIFISSMLKLHENENKTVSLSTIERDFTHHSKYDDNLYNAGESLDYIDIEKKSIITLRGLSLIHAPQKYRFEEMLINRIDEMLISGKNGEFVHPGEYDKLQNYKQTLEKKESIIYKSNKKDTNDTINQHHAKRIEDKTLKRSSIMWEAVPCEICGVRTKNWSSLDLSTGKCLCKDCLEKKNKNMQE